MKFFKLKIKHTTFFDHLILIAGAIFLTAPLVLLFLTSTHDNVTIAKEGLQLTLGSEFQTVYGRMLFEESLFANGVNALDMLINSISVATGFATILTFISALSAYALVYFNIKHAELIFFAIVLTMFFPIETRILPTFLTVRDLGLTNSYAGIVLPITATGIGTFILRQYFRQVPNELTDAARIDGAGAFKFFIDILAPISARAILAIFMVLFVLGWNQYLWPLVVTLSDDGLFTLVRGIERVGREGNAGMALAILTILPPVLLVFLMQSLIIEGLKSTGGK